ncbi:hypothetical protein L6R50_16960 [Myxococcota bacterium]|nr:hypothetical protein [Myxococcota bacterium]
MKTVHVALAFHAHTSFPGLAARLRDLSGDAELAAVPAVGEDGLAAAVAGVERLLALGEALSAPVTLQASNEWLATLRRSAGEAYGALRSAYRDGRIHSLYGHAHAGHAALLTAEEIADEVRLNREYLHEIMAVPEPRHPGALPPWAAVEADGIDGYRAAGCEYVVFPDVSAVPAPVRIAPSGGDVTWRAFVIDGLLALPRHRGISQGLMEGPESRARYAESLGAAVRACPDGGLLLSLPDTGLADCDEGMMEAMGKAWSQVRDEGLATVHFVTLGDYLDTAQVLEKSRVLPRLSFDRVSWWPGSAPILSVDGHFPALGEGRVAGTPVGAFHRDHPDAPWMPGRFAAALVDWLLPALAFPLALPHPAGWYVALDLDPGRMGAEDRIVFLARLLKSGDDWVWTADEGAQAKTWLCLWHVLDAARELNASGRVPSPAEPLEERVWEGMEAVLTLGVDRRVDALVPAVRARPARGVGEGDVDADAREVRWRRDRAADALGAARRSAAALPAGGGSWEPFLGSAREHFKEALLATVALARLWTRADDVREARADVDRRLAAVFPPHSLGVMDRLYPGGGRPRLRYPRAGAPPPPAAPPGRPRPALH